MRSNLNRRFRMCQSVRDVLNDYQSIVAPLPGLKRCADKFTDQFAVIDAGTTIGVKTTTGVTEAKNQLTQRLISNAFMVANAVWSYGDEVHDEELKASVPVVESDYLRGKDVDRLGKFRAVADAARPIAGRLADFGITEQILAELNADVAVYSTAMNAPRSTRSKNAQQLAGFIDDFKAMDEVLIRLDRAVNALKATQAEFFQAYDKARYLGTGNLKKEKELPMPEPRRTFAPPTTATAPTSKEEMVMIGGSPFDKPVPAWMLDKK